MSILAHDSLPVTFVLYTTYLYNWDQRTIGLVLAAVGAMSIVVQGGLVGRLVAALGERRAEAAKKFLADLGIDAKRISTISYGEERPLDPRKNEEAWAKNRNAGFVVN